MFMRWPTAIGSMAVGLGYSGRASAQASATGTVAYEVFAERLGTVAKPISCRFLQRRMSPGHRNAERSTQRPRLGGWPGRNHFRGDLEGTPIFSPDGQHVAYFGRSLSIWSVAVDGQLGRAYNQIGTGTLLLILLRYSSGTAPHIHFPVFGARPQTCAGSMLQALRIISIPARLRKQHSGLTRR